MSGYMGNLPNLYRLGQSITSGSNPESRPQQILFPSLELSCCCFSLAGVSKGVSQRGEPSGTGWNPLPNGREYNLHMIRSCARSVARSQQIIIPLQYLVPTLRGLQPFGVTGDYHCNRFISQITRKLVQRKQNLHWQ
jgi:hypothetical protein